MVGMTKTKVEIGKNYHLILELLITLYKNNNYKIEKDIYDEKGKNLICYLCLKPIKEEHPYFIISNKGLNMVTEIRTHKKCIDNLIN